MTAVARLDLAKGTTVSFAAMKGCPNVWEHCKAGQPTGNVSSCEVALSGFHLYFAAGSFFSQQNEAQHMGLRLK
jgi:hypothetical protein